MTAASLNGRMKIAVIATMNMNLNMRTDENKGEFIIPTQLLEFDIDESFVFLFTKYAYIYNKDLFNDGLMM